MIKDKLTNADTYYGISERLKQGFEWLKNNDLLNIPDGRYLIDGEKIFANVQSYITKDDAPYEAHRRYADIQYMIKGLEKVGVTDYSNCTTDKEYDKEKDIEFLHCNICSSYQTLEEGEFLVFYPQDAHQPSLTPDNKLSVKKVIVKVEIYRGGAAGIPAAPFEEKSFYAAKMFFAFLSISKSYNSPLYGFFSEASLFEEKIFHNSPKTGAFADFLFA